MHNFLTLKFPATFSSITFKPFHQQVGENPVLRGMSANVALIMRISGLNDDRNEYQKGMMQLIHGLSAIPVDILLSYVAEFLKFAEVNKDNLIIFPRMGHMPLAGGTFHPKPD